MTRLALGEGLVGTIAAEGRILNLDEAASHPAFAYRPETGEERFHSFAGVPIVRRENAIGVLAVQHAEPRCYENVEIEALQTVAMVLSEMIANARLADGGRRGRGETGAQRLTGLKLVTGMPRSGGSKLETAFTVSIEARDGVTTGISAADRARTIAVAIDSANGPDVLKKAEERAASLKD